MYKPSKKILDRYADVLVNFALNSGQGVRKGEVVQCVVPDVAKPMYGSLQQAILKAGAIPLMRFVATGFDRDYYQTANVAQLTFFPKKYIRSRVDLIDHTIAIISEHDLHELDGVDPKKIIKSAESRKQTRDWLNDKEYRGKYTWTLALYGTEAMAREAKMDLESYWKVIIKACFLNEADPIGKWSDLFSKQKKVVDRLNNLDIEKLHIEAEKTDLWISLGKRRKWVGGRGRNIPSFEIFTSPDWRGTEGVIAFNQPLYRYGNLITDIELIFESGKVVKATASKNQELLEQLIGRPNADRVGEFSLTDSRASTIDKFMANTLYDENIGGKYGNTHIAVGMSYKDAYDGDAEKLSKDDMEKLGFNDSGEHCDMMSTSNRRVTALLRDGIEKVIYDEGKFLV